MQAWRTWIAVSAAFASLSLPSSPARATLPPDDRRPPDPVGDFWQLIEDRAEACNLKAKERGAFGQVNIRFKGPTRFEKRATTGLSADLVACVTRAADAVVRAGGRFPWRLRKAASANYDDPTEGTFILGELRLELPDAARWADDWRVLADVTAPAAKRAKARAVVRRLLPVDITIDAKGCLDSPFYVIKNLAQDWIEKASKPVAYNWLSFFPSGTRSWVLTRELAVLTGIGPPICPLPLTANLKRELRAKMDAAGSCWQGDTADLLVEPHARLPSDRRYRWAAVAGTRACGVDEAGAIVCCGYPIPAAPPPGRFTRVDMIAQYSCAVREDQTAACWPEPGTGTTMPTITGRYTEFALTPFAGCAKRVDGGFTCWGKPVPPDDVANAAREIALDQSGYGVLRRDGSMVWGTFGSSEVHEGPRDLVEVRRFYTLCGLTRTGEVTCQGSKDFGEHWALASRERFHDIAIMGSTGCGRRRDDTLECWGGSTHYSPLRVPAGQFRQIAGSTGQVCGVRVDGTVACGGYRSDWMVFD